MKITLVVDVNFNRTDLAVRAEKERMLGIDCNELRDRIENAVLVAPGIANVAGVEARNLCLVSEDGGFVIG
jgi:hypothetical protein